MFKHNTTCRLCKSKSLVKFLDLGKMPLAGAFPTKQQFKKEDFYPLRVYFCKNCKSVQLLDVVSKKELFQKHFYLSSVSKTLSQHFAKYAQELVELLNPKRVVEIGSNDGVLLKPLKELGVRAIGVEPCKQVANIARSKGLEVIINFFTETVAKNIAKKFGKVDAICANNVFAHVDNLDELMRGVRILLKDNGVFIFEVHYLADLIDKLQYDMVYHEHMSYFSIIALKPYLEKFNMEIFDVRRIPIHSGSIHIYARNRGIRKGSISRNVNKIIKLERKMKLNRLETFLRFAENVKLQKKKLTSLLKNLRKRGKEIVGFGAGGRCSVIANYCNIGPELVKYVVDDSPLRQGKYVPGTHIPILPTQNLEKDNPDYIILFAWNYMGEILKRYESYIHNGGKFIIPLPKVRTIP